MNRILFRLYTLAAIPFILFVVAINLLHPLLHGLEGGSLDALLPMLDLMALSVGGGRVVEWSRGRGHRHEHHEGEACDLDDRHT